MSPALASALKTLQQHPHLQSLTLDDISCYARLVGHLKRDILQPQPLDQSTNDKAPDILPPSIVYFLNKALQIPLNLVQPSWDILKDCLWECKKVPLKKDDYELFKQFGWDKGISEQWFGNNDIVRFTLELAAMACYPPSDMCTKELCPNMKPLKKEKPRRVLIYTLANGAQPAWALHTSCRSKNILIDLWSCLTSY
jgi:hypothetical protein